MDGIEEEGRFSTDPTQHPKMQMHLEEIDDRWVAIIFKNSIPILYMIHLFAFPFTVGTTCPPLLPLPARTWSVFASDL